MFAHLTDWREFRSPGFLFMKSLTLGFFLEPETGWNAMYHDGIQPHFQLELWVE